MPPYIADFERGTNFATALAARAHVSASGQRDVILVVTDSRHTHYVHNLILNLAKLGVDGRTLAIGSSEVACTRLLARAPSGSVGCGYSSWMRNGINATMDAALDRWNIGPKHVYHLWWQRWHYLSWAVQLGYSAMSLDTDISLRANVYELLHGRLSHHHLFIGLDHEASGKERPNVFPMINVGLVYCQRCVPDGPAHRVLREVTRRVQQFLFGEVLYQTRHGRSGIAVRVLWEQDLFKDAIEHVAYRLPMHASRHARSNADPQPGVPHHDLDAPTRGWRFESVEPATGSPPARFPWLLLPAGATHPGMDALPVFAAASAAEMAASEARALRAPGTESLLALPLWVFSPWNVPPHGAACAGQWAEVPSPVMIGHMVGSASKGLTMRQLGWWHYDVTAFDCAAATAATAAIASTAAASTAIVPTSVGGGSPVVWHASSVSPTASPSSAPVPPPRVFPPSTRVLVLRSHGVHIHTSEDIPNAWEVVRRFAMLGLLLGRRPVLPLLPCALSPCAPRVPNPLRASLVMISFGDAAACADPEPGVVAGEPVETRVSEATLLREMMVGGHGREGGETPYGWVPSPNTSRWWWVTRPASRRRGQRATPPRVRRGCCQAVPAAVSCVDPSGARRPMCEEPLLCAADLRRLLAEQQAQNQKATTWATGGSAGRVVSETAVTAEGGPHRLVELVTLQSAEMDGVNRTLERLLSSSATVLVLDAERQASERLPSLIRVASHATHTSRSAWADASSWADARSGVGLYAARCLARLRRRD